MDLQTQIKILSSISAIAAGVFFSWIVYIIIRSRIEKSIIKKTLDKTQENFELFSKSVSDIIYRYNVKSNIFDFISPSFEWQTGYHLTKFKDEPLRFIKKLINPEDWNILVENLNEHITSINAKEPFANEYRIIKKNGDMVWVNDHKDFEFDQTGELCIVNGVITNITKRKEAEERLKRQEEKYRGIVKNIPVLLCRFLPKDGIITFANEAFCIYYNKTPEELIGKSIFDLVPADEHNSIKEHYHALKPDNPTVTHRHRAITPGGERWQQWTDQALFDEDGNVAEYQSIGQDVTDQIIAHERIKTSLNEKSVLLKEVIHRTKNNLQVISSLLDLVSIETGSAEIDSLFKDTKAKINTMALIHTQLYSSDRFDRINIKKHIKDLMRHLFQLYSYGKSIEPIIEGEEVYLTLEHAMPCALVLTELISNIFKHAFKERKKGKIHILLKKTKGNKIIFKVKDDGVGIPRTFDINKASNLGLKLVKSIVEDQLLGKIEFKRNKGTVVRFEFTLLEKEKNAG
ncbi:PAS domain S-box protein [bacterium]|nr:PAS domain S-box protein [bacterium]